MNYVIFLKLYFILIIWVCACPDNYREAIRCKSSHFIRQAPGFPLLSLTRNGFNRQSCHFRMKGKITLETPQTNNHNICHFDGGEISTSSSTKIGDMHCGFTCEDLLRLFAIARVSFVEMTKLCGFLCVLCVIPCELCG